MIRIIPASHDIPIRYRQALQKTLEHQELPQTTEFPFRLIQEPTRIANPCFFLPQLIEAMSSKFSLSQIYSKPYFSLTLFYGYCKQGEGLLANGKTVKPQEFSKSATKRAYLAFELHQVKKLVRQRVLHFCLQANGQTIFKVRVIDSNRSGLLNKVTCSVFVVPYGREAGFMFNTIEGNFQLLDQIKTSRLILVSCAPGTPQKSMQEIVKEIESSIKLMLPDGHSSSAAYLTDGEEMAEKSVLLRNQYAIVEDLRVQDQIYRRFILSENVDQIQSQVRLVPLKSSTQQLKSQLEQQPLTVDQTYLDFESHQVIFSAIFGLESILNSPSKILILGAGACALPSFLLSHLPLAQVVAVDISEQVLQIGQKYFGVQEEKRLQIVCEDAYEFVIKGEGKFDVVVMDINGKIGQSSPPQIFMSEEFNKGIRSRLKQGGMFCAHLIRKGSQFYKREFCPVYRYFNQKDVFEVYFCFKNESIQKSVEHLGKTVTVYPEFSPFLHIKPVFTWQENIIRKIKLNWPCGNGGLEHSQYLFDQEGNVKNKLTDAIFQEQRKVRKNKRNKR